MYYNNTIITLLALDEIINVVHFVGFASNYKLQMYYNNPISILLALDQIINVFYAFFQITLQLKK
jgi:hypothetical protein